MIATVTQAEANVLTIARTAVGLVPPADIMRLLVTSTELPQKMGPTARRLLEDTLSKGTVLALARQGGWLPDPAAPSSGRLWARRQPPKLEFTGNVIRLFQWVLRSPLGEIDVTPLAIQGSLTLAESIVATLLLDALRGTGCETALARQEALRRSPLVVLTHAAELARAEALEEVPPFDIAELEPAIEGLRGVLSRAWYFAEQNKRDLDEPAVLSRVGDAQARVLDAFLSALDRAHRRGLATFMVDAAERYYAMPRTVEDLARGLSTDSPLRERTEARRAAAAFARALGQLRGWHEQHRTVHFIDDEYDVAQALAGDWARLTRANATTLAPFDAAAALVAAVDAL